MENQASGENSPRVRTVAPPELPEQGAARAHDPASLSGGEASGGLPMEQKTPPSGGGFGGMGSDDVKLKYSDDDPDSYANIFSSAKTDVTEADQERLIQALKERKSVV